MFDMGFVEEGILPIAGRESIFLYELLKRHEWFCYPVVVFEKEVWSFRVNV